MITNVSLTDGTDVLYNKFDLSQPSSSDSNCATATATGQWRMSNCVDQHLVVCQSHHLIPGMSVQINRPSSHIDLIIHHIKLIIHVKNSCHRLKELDLETR